MNVRFYFYMSLLSAVVATFNLKAAPTEYHFYTEQFPPYSYLQQNAITGINVDLVNALCQRLQLSCTITLLPWRRAFEQAQHHHFSGVFSTSRSADRESLFHWVGPIASEPGYLFRLKGRTEINPTNLTEAKNYIVAVSRGDRLEAFLQSNGFNYDRNLMGFSTRTEPIPLFLANKVDLLAGSKRALRSWMLEQNMPADTAEPLFKLEDVGKHYLALNLRFPTDIALAMQVELDNMRKNGELAALVQSYQ